MRIWWKKSAFTSFCYILLFWWPLWWSSCYFGLFMLACGAGQNHDFLEVRYRTNSSRIYVHFASHTPLLFVLLRWTKVKVFWGKILFTHSIMKMKNLLVTKYSELSFMLVIHVTIFQPQLKKSSCKFSFSLQYRQKEGNFLSLKFRKTKICLNPPMKSLRAFFQMTLF